MTINETDPPLDFDWQPQPLAAAFVNELVEDVLAARSDIGLLAQRMRDETGTRLVDWLETIMLEDTPAMRDKISAAGFVKGKGQFWRNTSGLFPKLGLHREDTTIKIKVDSVDDFTSVWQEPFAIDICGDAAGSQFQIEFTAQHRAAFAARKRSAGTTEQGFQLAQSLFDSAASDLDHAWATSLFFAAERDYWMSRNHAARVQYERQQKLGLGWANHDHHTYRSSRDCFHLLVGGLERMGFACRERFYAGREAGWGAQVLEHAACGLVVFADVDLSPEEIADDFAHVPLPARQELGTVGLWCALHGESFLEAGMHHLECQFYFDGALGQLAGAGIETMAPFTDFPHLKQTFSQGETWQVAPMRLDNLLAQGHIDSAQAEQFRSSGALGSHLEILERNDGYKGFNQTGISEIITRTDPRKGRK